MFLTKYACRHNSLSYTYAKEAVISLVQLITNLRIKSLLLIIYYPCIFVLFEGTVWNTSST